MTLKPQSSVMVCFFHNQDNSLWFIIEFCSFLEKTKYCIIVYFVFYFIFVLACILDLCPCFYQMTLKEAFRLISHKFHGKGPGKMNQEKRMKQYLEELKLKNMKNSYTPSDSVERMREAQMQLKTPYLVLSGHVKPGYASFIFVIYSYIILTNDCWISL